MTSPCAKGETPPTPRAAIAAGLVVWLVGASAGAEASAAPAPQQAPLVSEDAYNAAEKTTQGNLGHPFVLPAASRARMHECALQWQAMKMSGEAADKIWRVFATACLTSPAAKAADSRKTR